MFIACFHENENIIEKKSELDMFYINDVFKYI